MPGIPGLSSHSPTVCLSPGCRHLWFLPHVPLLLPKGQDSAVPFPTMCSPQSGCTGLQFLHCSLLLLSSAQLPFVPMHQLFNFPVPQLCFLSHLTKCTRVAFPQPQEWDHVEGRRASHHCSFAICIQVHLSTSQSLVSLWCHD